MLVNYSTYLAVRMNLFLGSLSISSLIFDITSGANLLNVYFNGLFLCIWLHHLNLFRIIQHVHIFDHRFVVFSDLNHHDINRFEEIDVFDLQRVIINLHRLFGFVSKLQPSVFQSKLYYIPENNTLRGFMTNKFLILT